MVIHVFMSTVFKCYNATLCLNHIITKTGFRNKLGKLGMKPLQLSERFEKRPTFLILYSGNDLTSESRQYCSVWLFQAWSSFVCVLSPWHIQCSCTSVWSPLWATFTEKSLNNSTTNRSIRQSRSCSTSSLTCSSCSYRSSTGRRRNTSQSISQSGRAFRCANSWLRCALSLASRYI